MNRIGWPGWRSAVTQAAILVLLLSARTTSGAGGPPDFAALETAARGEMREWGIPGIAIAAVEDQKIIYSARLGDARPDGVFRCGSISKLFTAVAAMRLVSEGKLDLDAPIERYAPEVAPVNPFPGSPSVTVRQLLCHRSGMVREAPVGGYLDDSEPGLDAMARSVAQTVLPTPPLAGTRYSNVGPSLAGYLVARLSGTSFPEYQRAHILGPLGMNDSAWRLGDLRRRVVPSRMRVAQAPGGFKFQRTPVFDLGTIPAGNLFTTAEDLARFVAMLAADGRAPDGAIVLPPGVLEQMFTPQLTDRTNGFGIGFSVESFQGRKAVAHSGAVYGFSSSLVFLPGEKIGIVVLGNADIVNGRIQKLANLGLALMLGARTGGQPPAPPETIAMPEAQLAEFAGEYESQSYWASLSVRAGRLFADVSGQPTRLRPVAPLGFRADSALYDSAEMTFERDAGGRVAGFQLANQHYRRVPAEVRPIPAEWRKLLGSYGPSFIPLVVSVRHGHLYAMTENMVDYRLTPVNQDVFGMPPGMYVSEQLVFFPGRGGKTRAVSLAGMVLERR